VTRPHRRPTTYARRSARVLLVDSDDRILLICYALSAADPTRGHAWFTPGGGVEPGEDLVEAAVRELDEEVGLAVRTADLRLVAYTSGHADLGFASGLFRDDFFLCRVDGHEVDTARQTTLERQHYQGHRWWTLAELAATTETVYPLGLVGLLADIKAGRRLDLPVELPWHHA
jgi:8-oxo-dGTP pyrophosphatase MutT (NUDIX family)